ncbi:phosphoribosyltransferase [Rhodonellum sp.]|uniref:phosphoribosyltransferase n=1 Tax=Rhodonellum sp. TaxID=2231180 RepID=UPI00272809B0|nr:phosphoribosyltransferase family protein [Rhodonellum sp.]MDO9554487.1 phosphoribosyltransferase family protein [Rhodonellum sp.]
MSILFRNRNEAALLLADQLIKYRGKDGIVLSIPRGGVPMAAIVAKNLGFPLEIILSKKIGHPLNPEYAIGSVTMDTVLVDDSIADVDKSYIKNEIDRLSKELKKRFEFFMGNRKPASLKNKIVIVVDDGIATGHTMKSTIESIRKENPKELIVAVPVAPPRTAREVREMVDELICLHTPDDFYGVGQFYADFGQVSDDEVIALLKEMRENPTS